MKFKSEFGLKEICIYNENATRGDKSMPDILVKIVAVVFDVDGQTNYTVEHIGSHFGVQRFGAAAASLTGDPIFDQDKGAYPEETE